MKIDISLRKMLEPAIETKIDLDSRKILYRLFKHEKRSVEKRSRGDGVEISADPGCSECALLIFDTAFLATSASGLSGLTQGPNHVSPLDASPNRSEAITNTYSPSEFPTQQPNSLAHVPMTIHNTLKSPAQERPYTSSHNTSNASVKPRPKHSLPFRFDKETYCTGTNTTRPDRPDLG